MVYIASAGTNMSVKRIYNILFESLCISEEYIRLFLKSTGLPKGYIWLLLHQQERLKGMKGCCFDQYTCIQFTLDCYLINSLSKCQLHISVNKSFKGVYKVVARIGVKMYLNRISDIVLTIRQSIAWIQCSTFVQTNLYIEI